MFLATGFTPNNDGINDKVVLRGINADAQVELFIFNEYGELVFESTSINASWDGLYKGQDANAGNYSYLLKINNNNLKNTYKGIITLIR